MLRRHAYSLDGEFATAHVKEVFKIGSQKIDREDIMQALSAEVMDLRNANWGPDRKGTRRRASNAAVGARTMKVGRVNIRVPFKVR